MIMKLFLVIVLAFLVPTGRAQYRFACEPNFCSAFVGPCDKEAECEDGRVIKNATQCGCCDICVKTLKKGEACLNKELASIPRTECGPGLICVEGKCAPANTQCIRDQLAYDEDRRLLGERFVRPRPKCDNFGDYQPVVCKEDMLCFCVDKNGTRIFGTALAIHNASMNCNCSRDFLEFRAPMKRADQFLLCAVNGNYDPMQCTDEYCYCIGEDGKLSGRPIHVNSSIAKLKCFDSERHGYLEKRTSSKCWRERDLTEARIKDYMENFNWPNKKEYSGIPSIVIGIDLPECDLDGSYRPIQCKDNYCMCVNRDGNPITHIGSTEDTYKVERHSELARNMNCRCARDKEFLLQPKSTNVITFMFSQFQCLPNGNYRTLQCVDSNCFCVDDMGFQTDVAVPEQAKHFLDCYEREKN